RRALRALGHYPAVPADPGRASAAGVPRQRPVPGQGQRAGHPERQRPSRVGGVAGRAGQAHRQQRLSCGHRQRHRRQAGQGPGNNAFHAVIDSDIAGKQAKAPEIDRQLGSEYAKESVSEKLARATFLYSFGGGHQKGATLPQLRLAVLNPEMAPPFVSDALNRMSRRLWYLYAESGLYSFEARPNLNRILIDREELVRSEQDKVRDFIRSTLNDMIGEAAFKVYRYPESDRDVADESRSSLVILDLHQPAGEDGLPPATEAFVTTLLKQHG